MASHSFVYPVDTAAELIEKLRPTNPRWISAPRCWIFRGQRDSEWHLLSSAFREESWLPFRRTDAPPAVDREFLLLQEFLSGLDQSGLDVPNGIVLSKAFEKGPAHVFKYPIDSDVLPFIALAQHYGLPTRLLDWTRIPMNAAYFAAAGAAQRLKEAHGDKQPTHLSIWAFRSDFGPWCDDCFRQLNINTRKLCVVAAPRASNPNLHAQSGVFTQSSESDPIEHAASELVTRLETDGYRFSSPPLVRLDLPTTESPKLLRLLADEQIDGARMFPGREGIALAMRERALWDR